MSAQMGDERAEKLREYVERVMALQAKVDAKKLAVRAIYAEVKAAGYDKTSVGKIIGYLRLPADKRAQFDSTPHASVAMPLREWAADLSSAPGLAAALSQPRD